MATGGWREDQRVQHGCHVRSGAVERIDAAVADRQPLARQGPARTLIRQGDGQGLGGARIGVRDRHASEGVGGGFGGGGMIRGGARDGRRDRRRGLGYELRATVNDILSAPRSTNHKVCKAVAVEVSRPEGGCARMGARNPINDEAALAQRHVAQIDRIGIGLAEDDIDLACAAIGVLRGDEQIVKPVAIDVASGADDQTGFAAAFFGANGVAVVAQSGGDLRCGICDARPGGTEQDESCIIGVIRDDTACCGGRANDEIVVTIAIGVTKFGYGRPKSYREAIGQSLKDATIGARLDGRDAARQARTCLRDGIHYAVAVEIAAKLLCDRSG